MKESAAISPPAEMLGQTSVPSQLSTAQRDDLIVSMVRVDGSWQVACRFAADVWPLIGATSNRRKSQTKLKFGRAPAPFREPLKQIMFRYSMRGLNGIRPAATTQYRFFEHAVQFTRFLHRVGVQKFCDVTSTACANYAKEVKDDVAKVGRKSGVRGKLATTTIERKLATVEWLHELSQFTTDAMPRHPWPDSSATELAGIKSASNRDSRQSRTPLIPDSVFSVLFQRAQQIVENAGQLLDLRDMLDAFDDADAPATTVIGRKNVALHLAGWTGTLRSLGIQLLEVRTACYIVVATLSGCRNHELANIKVGSTHSTIDDQGEQYWWMRSVSEKTYEGETEWMIPEAAVKALQIMDRLSAPYQRRLLVQIGEMRAVDPNDPEIAEALKHVGSIFVGWSNRTGEVRTVSGSTWNLVLKSFAVACDVEWELSSHQFRRKFANYAARSQFGDLRYLKEHFKHWSIDMTLGYAMNESQEMSLYLEVMEELDGLKFGVAERWLNSTEPLAGGYGQRLIDWRSSEDTITLFKGHKQMVTAIATGTPIRSNGHAWCTADDNLCVGNDLERTRCSECSGAAIERQHSPFYQHLYDELKGLLDCADIGEGGRARVRRDLARCRLVLTNLGHVPLEAAA